MVPERARARHPRPQRLRADGAEWALVGVLVVVMAAATVALARAAARDAAPVPA